MFNNLKNRSFLILLFKIFMLITIFGFLGVAIPLLILFFPFIITTYIDYFFYHKQIEPPILYGLTAFVITTIFLALLMIRKFGAENVWKIMIGYDVYYTGKSGKYYKWFVYFIIFLMILALLAIFLQAFF